MTEETKRKISIAHTGMRQSEEAKRKISKFNKGKKLSKETKRKIGVASSLRMTPERRRQLSELFRGSKGNNWKDGRMQNREYVSWLKNRRNYKLRVNGGSHSYGEWENLKAQYNWSCPHCGKKEPEIKLTIDHIIPVSKGGTDNIENIQPLCRSCNSIKSNKL